jgi:hypothetical protein
MVEGRGTPDRKARRMDGVGGGKRGSRRGSINLQLHTFHSFLLSHIMLRGLRPRDRQL